MAEPYTNKTEKESIELIYSEAIAALGASDFAMLGGYYYEESNSRARRRYEGTITLNEKFLGIPPDEQQRDAYHEIQHTINNKRFVESDEDARKALYAFIFHPRFIDLHDRMENYYNFYAQKGYPFQNTVEPIPEKLADMGGSSNSYTHPDEVLALLRGYQRYLKQKETGVDTKTEPYEFIEAFLPGDIELLDEQVRFKLATEVLERDPHILDSPIEKPLDFTKKTRE